jgi:hypothetical protein
MASRRRDDPGAEATDWALLQFVTVFDAALTTAAVILFLLGLFYGPGLAEHGLHIVLIVALILVAFIPDIGRTLLPIVALYALVTWAIDLVLAIRALSIVYNCVASITLTCSNGASAGQYIVYTVAAILWVILSSVMIAKLVSVNSRLTKRPHLYR